MFELSGILQYQNIVLLRCSCIVAISILDKLLPYNSIQTVYVGGYIQNQSKNIEKKIIFGTQWPQMEITNEKKKKEKKNRKKEKEKKKKKKEKNLTRTTRFS